VITFLLVQKVSPFERKVRPLQTLLLISFWIAPLVMPDLAQAIFGRDLEGKHWVRRIGYPMSIIGLGLIAGEIRKKWVNAAAGLILLTALGYGAAVQVNMSKKAAFAYAVDKDKQEFYEFINTQLPSGSVIASLDWETIVDIPAKTHGFNFSPIGMRTIASTEESINRFLWAASLYGASDEYVEQAFSARGDGTTRALYFKFAEDNEVFSVPPELTRDIEQRYQEIVARNKNGSLPPFKLDYVLIGPEERESFKLFVEKMNLKQVFSNKNYLIYSVSWL
jgi:hypothetical protein